MRKNFCDCCGKEVETWYVFSICALSDQNKIGYTTESFSHNLSNVFAPEKIYCCECKNKALSVLNQTQEE